MLTYVHMSFTQDKEDGGKENCIKFMLLNPALHFADIVAEAKSVSQVLHSLLLGVDRERIDLFSCGHIIPPANLTAGTSVLHIANREYNIFHLVALGVGPTNTELDFTFSKRNTRPIMDEVGRIVLNLVRVVPGGVVVFFPSYSYENQVILHWKSTGAILFSVVGGKMSEGINFSNELARYFDI
ncbi:hypothetical protein DYB28_002192 [Aphanomyces astaci]|uniref:ATP-dependent helicase C-terminal domain-containing protein n=1 Tax=Aphanomyces astaci TaxID=112090 RepID=A0A9X8HC04_APHAT|nr:hypothetical protein DYB28_002192 [Aphanomyces astaci]